MYLNAKEASARLGISERTVRRWIHSGRLSAAREHGAFVIDPRDLENAVGFRRDLQREPLGELRGRYLELRDRATRLEQLLAEEQRRAARLEAELNLRAARAA